MNQRILCCGGKFGDLCAILPILWHEIQQGQNTALMVSEDYASLFYGISWMKPIIHHGPAHDIEGAMEQAKKLSDNVQLLQVAGPPDVVKKYCYDPTPTPHATTGSFVREMWKLAGHAKLWQEQPPLIFDNRDKEREKVLLDSVRAGDNRRVLLVANKSESSPFVAPDLLFELVRLRFRREYKIVNLSEVKAERFYDILALYERARCLVTIDTAALHLAPAVPNLPVMALVNDGWKGSPWRPNHAFHCRYSDWPSRAMEMITAIERLDGRASWFYAPKRKPVIVHVWNAYQPETPGLWDGEYENGHWVKCPGERHAFGRDSRRIAKDTARQPFIRDLFNMAALRAGPDDILCLTRSGTQPESGLTDTLLAETPCWGHRSVQGEQGLTYHPSTDLFAFRKSFWREHGDELPDMICGVDGYWPRILREWLRRHGAKELQFAVSRQPSTAETPRNAVTAHNEVASKGWLSRHRITMSVPKVTEQLPCMPINRKSLSPGGYNASIAYFDNRYVLTYRWHMEGASTVLALAELDAQFNVRSNHGIKVPGLSVEDARLFWHKGALWVSYVESNWPKSPTSLVRYGQLVKDAKGWRIEGQFQPQYGNNDGQHLEKNWVFFSRDGRLFCIYISAPEQIVIELEGSKVVNQWITPIPHWRFGERKGGCIVEHDGKLLRFFHSTLDNEPAPNRRRYYVGACLMEAEQPFNVVSIGKEPVLRGSETDDLLPTERSGISHHKGQVIFPCGVVANKDGGWLLSCGLNDSHIVLAKVQEKDLKL